MFDRRVAARRLRLHVLVFGGGWLAIAFCAVAGIGVLGDVAHATTDLSPALAGAGFVVLVAVALPLAWPIYLALLLFESNLADRIRRGDAGALSAARTVLRIEALVSISGAIAVIGFAIWIGRVNGSEYLVLAWLPLVVFAIAHEVTARAIGITS